MPDRVRVKVGEKIKVIMPWSEVCMHLNIAGKTMTCELLGRGVQLYDEEGNKFSFPITHGEAGFYEGNQIGDAESWYYVERPQSQPESSE